MKVNEQHFRVVLFIILCKVGTFKAVNENVVCESKASKKYFRFL